MKYKILFLSIIANVALCYSQSELNKFKKFLPLIESIQQSKKASKNFPADSSARVNKENFLKENSEHSASDKNVDSSARVDKDNISKENFEDIASDKSVDTALAIDSFASMVGTNKNAFTESVSLRELFINDSIEQIKQTDTSSFGERNYIYFFEIITVLCITFYFIWRNRKRIFRGEQSKKYFLRGRESILREMAEGRRRRIREFLDNENINRYEFIETPPNYDSLPTRYFELKEDEIAQRIRLEWQLQNDYLLIAERIVDAVLFFSRLNNSSKTLRTEGLPTIKIKLNNKAPGWKKNSRYIAVVETSYIEYYRDLFAELEKWFGIPIKFEPESEVKLLGQCQIGGSFTGLTGGKLTSGGTVFHMTCEHVLSATCNSVVYRSNSLNGQQPDAALLMDGVPCFNVLPKNSSTLTCATPDDLILFSNQRSPVCKIYPGKNKPIGFISCHVCGYSINGVYKRFPTVQIFPKRTRYGLLALPLIKKNFSYEGDSGTWVIEQDTGKWIGMVISGDPSDYFTTYVEEAQPLLDYFSAVISNNKNINLTPTSY
jgi:hypothetical protein